MQRKRFLKLSGFSAASLLFTRINPVSGEAQQELASPNEVSVLSSGKWLPLTRAGDHWNFRQISVTLGATAEGTAVHLAAPESEIEKIKIGWKYSTPSGASFLGDHWERSYGDLAWKSISPVRKAPWYLLIHDGRNSFAFGVKTGANSICYWQAGPEQLELFLDTGSGGMGVMPGDRVLKAAEIITTASLPGENPFETDTRFCKMMCGKPVLPAKPVYGINDWYFAYGNNSRELILRTTGIMAELSGETSNPPFSVIDDGWSVKNVKGTAVYSGDDFTRPNEKFGDMQLVASEIKKLGMRPGLWTRPLLANGNDPQSALIPLREEHANQRERYLDPTIPENLQRIQRTIELYNHWGYELVKHDYSTYDLFGRWGFQMNEALTSPGWHLNDRSKTNAEIILDLYRVIRKAAGNMYLIGCNTMSHLSAGIFELNRIGDDTSGKEWTRTVKMGVNTLGFRLPQHNNFYAADGDCVGLTTNIPWNENKQWLQLLAESGAPLFISAQPEALGPEQKAAVKKSFAMAAKPQPRGEPLDWLTNPRPADWKLNGRTVRFDWT
jgi:alpha-galactosidase